MTGLGRASFLTVNNYDVLSGIYGGFLLENEIGSGGIKGRHRRHMDHLRILFGVEIEIDIHHRASVKRRWA